MRRLSTRSVLAAIVATSAVVACSSFSSSDPTLEPLVEGGTVGEGGEVVDGGPPSEASVVDVVVVDAGAEAGQLQLRAFVTTVGYADITTSASADAKCSAEASGRFAGKFVAWLSAEGVSAPARLVDQSNHPVDGPWYRLDGKRIVANRAALSNTSMVPLENPIDINAAGVKATPSVWTGTKADGSAGAICPAPSPIAGTAGQTGPMWTEQKFFTAACGSSLGLYCFQVE